MAGTIINTGDVWARVARLCAAILLVGGMGVGPVVHLVAGAEQSIAGDHGGSGHGHEQGESRVPDAHHGCPVCITLAGATTPLAPAVRAVVVAGAGHVAASVTEPHDHDHSDLSRARAPPTG